MIPFSLNLLALWCACRLVCVRVRDILTSSSNQSGPFIEKRKLALTGQLSFVLVRLYYLTLIHSISQNVLPPRSFLSLSSAPLVPLFSLFHLGPRAIITILSQSFFHVLSCIFPETVSLPHGQGNRPNADAARAQRSPARYVRISATFAIESFSPTMKLIVHVGCFGWLFARRPILPICDWFCKKNYIYSKIF